MTQSRNNRFIIASAGSGKTTLLVEEARSRIRKSRTEKRIAILTYTNNNISEIKRKFHEKHGGIPKQIDVMTWFSFLLRECTRPYQRAVYREMRVRTITYPEGRSDRYAPYSNTGRYFFWNGDEIYSDKIARFIIDCDADSNGLVMNRLFDIYDEIFIDEFQDLAGWDLDLLELFLNSAIRMMVVGDPRQFIYTTNCSSKNSQYRGPAVMGLVQKWEKSALCKVEGQSISYRCNKYICDFANSFWPDWAEMKSNNNTVTGHDGVFVVSEENAHAYIDRYKPAVLRYDRNADSLGYTATNFGEAKGLEFDRVLIVPHGPMKKYLRSGDLNAVEKSLAKFYVAVTRARHSVAFLYDGEVNVNCKVWQP